ncbi:unnamed protein product [Orchesella dallaii]|uniref:E3 SUMO-protein ligase PIAS2 n=1 Tax=Orchesella dallaii TaxID=48710 RepID=A0ABP1RAR9_9HEXA
MDPHHTDLSSGVRMKRLPFYDVIVDLLKPTRLVSTSNQPGIQKGKVVFSLASWQTKIISKLQDHATLSNLQFHVFLRFFELDSNEKPVDLNPQDFGIKFNRIRVLQTYKKSTKKSFPLPLDITNEFIQNSKPSNNTIRASWREDNELSCKHNVSVSICLVKRLTVKDLIKRVAHSEDIVSDVKSLMTETDHEENLCTPTSIRVSLICPLGKVMMTYPCRATTCKHLQCFDAKQFLLLNEKKPTFICPVCDELLNIEDLRIDRFFDLVIKKVPKDGINNEIEILPDGRWRQVANRTMKQTVPSWGSVISTKCNTTEQIQDNYIDLGSDDSDDCVMDDEIKLGANEKAFPSSPEELELWQRKTIKVEPSVFSSDEEKNTTKEKTTESTNICDAKSLITNSSGGVSSGKPGISSASLKTATVVSNSTKPQCQVPEVPPSQPQPTPICTFKRNGVKELEYLSHLLKVPFSFSNFAMEKDYLSFVTLSTNPPHMAHSYGETMDKARDTAALKLLEEFTFSGLDPAATSKSC